MWSVLGVSEHKELRGAGGRRASLNGGWLNSSKWQNLHQMRIISVIGEGLSSRWGHVQQHKEKKDGKKTSPQFRFELHSNDRSDVVLSGRLGEEQPNDLVTAKRTTVSSASFEGQEHPSVQRPGLKQFKFFFFAAE